MTMPTVSPPLDRIQRGGGRVSVGTDGNAAVSKSLKIAGPRPWIDVTAPPYNAVDDGKYATTGSMSLLGNTLTLSGSTEDTFTPGMVGQPIAVIGAGPVGTAGSNDPLITTIATYISPTQVTLSASASRAVSNACVSWGTDNGPAIQTALDAASPGGTVIMPGSFRVATSRTTLGDDGINSISSAYLNIPSNVTVRGLGRGASRIITGCTSANINVFCQYGKTSLSIEHLTVINGQTANGYTTNNGDPIKLLGCDSFTIRSVEAIGGKYGYQVIGGDNGLLEDCRAWNTDSAGAGFSVIILTLANATKQSTSVGMKLSDCWAYANQAYGFRIQGESGNILDQITLSGCRSNGNAISSTNLAGYWIQYAKPQITNCISDGNNGSTGYSLREAHGTQFSNCSARDDLRGWTVQGCSRVHWSNCSFEKVSTGAVGIDFQDNGAVGSTDNVVANCRFEGATTSGVRDTTGTNSGFNRVIGCSFNGCTSNTTLKSTSTVTSGSLQVRSITIPFTDGDTMKRVTVTDALITSTSIIVCSVRRPDTTDDSADFGYLYIPNVVKVATGSFDVLIACTDGGFDDPVEIPPNETITLAYTAT